MVIKIKIGDKFKGYCPCRHCGSNYRIKIDEVSSKCIKCNYPFIEPIRFD